MDSAIQFQRSVSAKFPERPEAGDAGRETRWQRLWVSTLRILILALSLSWAVCGLGSEAKASSQAVAPPGTKPVEILKAGKSSHRIVIEPTASASEKHAAEELARYVKACTGVALPVIVGVPTNPGPMIVLGLGPMARGLGINPVPETLGEQGYVLGTSGPHLLIAGTPDAGTLYGVHRFLERYLGVRWYAPGVTKTPKVAELVIPPVHQVVRPAFSYRNVSYAWPGSDPDFRARMGDNAGGGGATHPQGTQYAFDGTCHSYFNYLSPAEFFATHPEYFSEIGGVRIAEETQLCLSNPEVLERVTERMLARMKAQPGVRQHNFSQMDYYNACQCARCRQRNDELGSPGGTQYWFVNRLAERTSKVFPGKLIGTLAYTYTEEPPKNFRMHTNVAVWLCHMFPCCDSHPIVSCSLNADYQRRARAWSKITSHLYAWHYIVNFAHYYNPFPNLRAMAADVRFYRQIGVEGVFLQGMGAGGGGGEFSLLRPYYGMKLLWDPEQPPDSLIRDFLEGYYGAAAGPIWNYIQLLHDKVEQEGLHMHLYTNPAQGYLPDALLGRAAALFDQAEALAGEDRELLDRVRVARLPLLYARLFPRNGYRITGEELVWQGEMGSPAEAVAFVDTLKRHGFQTIREMGGDPRQMVTLSGLFASRPKVLAIENECLRVEVVPALGGRALRITELRSGQCVTAHDTRRHLFFPFCGGLEDRVGEIFWSDGWSEPARVSSHRNTSITTVQTTLGGFGLTRRLALEPGQPVLRVETTLTNHGDKARGTRLRQHLELALGDLRRIACVFTNRAGRPTHAPIAEVISGLREGRHFYGELAPAGEWTLQGANGLQVLQRFDNDRTDFTWLHAFPEALGQLETEVWLKRQVLDPEQSVTVVQEIEVKAAE